MERILRLMTLNIGNPSLKRVQQQIRWLEGREEDIFVLTETKVSEGCSYLEQHFANPGMTLFDLGKQPEFNVFFPASSTGDLGVMVLSRYPILRTSTCFAKDNPYYSRLSDIVIDFYGQEIGIMGLYVPSRDASDEKIRRKKQFIIEFLMHLKQTIGQNSIPYVICGDLNILERNHYPHYSTFLKWEYDFYDRFEHFDFVDAFRLLYPDRNEYSWVGRTNDGYRYDHCFVSNSLSAKVLDCHYIHETRQLSITDHSAMALTLKL